jgi:AraC-like DNA-binding protein
MSNRISLNDANANILIVGYFPCKPEWKIPLYKSKNDCLFYIEKGKGWIDFDGQRVETKAGDLHVFKKGHYRELSHDKTDCFSVYSVLFQLEQSNNQRPLETLPFAHTYHLDYKDHLLTIEFYKNIINHFKLNTNADELKAKAFLLQFIAQVLEWEKSYPLSRKILNTSVNLKRDSRINDSVNYIFENISENVTVNDLSALCHLTADHFAKLFKKETGESPKNFIRKVKINHAKAMMVTTDKTINQIAREVGMIDPFYFSRSFTQITGISPSLYRKSLKSPCF